jgi:GNAT superfamily N-acetyltransferase
MAHHFVIGEARYALAPDRREVEFALSVADDWRGKGLGTLLMADIERRAELAENSGAPGTKDAAATGRCAGYQISRSSDR